MKLLISSSSLFWLLFGAHQPISTILWLYDILMYWYSYFCYPNFEIRRNVAEDTQSLKSFMGFFSAVLNYALFPLVILLLQSLMCSQTHGGFFSKKSPVLCMGWWVVTFLESFLEVWVWFDCLVSSYFLDESYFCIFNCISVLNSIWLHTDSNGNILKNSLGNLSSSLV